MNRKPYSILTVVAVAFALVLGFGTLNAAKAVPGTAGDAYNLPPGNVNLIGLDAADNSVRVIDRDVAPAPRGFFTDSYGLGLRSQQ